MATMAEKTERRWLVIKGILWYLAAYGITVVALFASGFEVSKLSTLTELLYGTSVIGIVGHWFSSPTKDTP